MEIQDSLALLDRLSFHQLLALPPAVAPGERGVKGVHGLVVVDLSATTATVVVMCANGCFVMLVQVEVLNRLATGLDGPGWKGRRLKQSGVFLYQLASGTFDLEAA